MFKRAGDLDTGGKSRIMSKEVEENGRENQPYMEHTIENPWFCVLQYLEEEYRKGAREDDPMPPVQPYHYGSPKLSLDRNPEKNS